VYQGPPWWLLMLACGFAISLSWFRLNVSASVPYGVYRLAAVPPSLQVGQFVVLPVPASMRSWHSRWLPLLKPVAAVAGEEVCHHAGRLIIRQQDFGPVLATAHGRPLPHMTGCLTVPTDSVFLASPVSRSLDSRYFLPVRLADLTAVAVPVLTWR
jgi:type IV secretory pathway protease TraF